MCLVPLRGQHDGREESYRQGEFDHAQLMLEPRRALSRPRSSNRGARCHARDPRTAARVVTPAMLEGLRALSLPTAARGPETSSSHHAIDAAFGPVWFRTIVGYGF